jgi:membrane associated rhomboid family serine protease
MRPLFARLSAERAQTYGLVLAAAGIEHQIRCAGASWSIAVWPAQRRPAIEAVALYLKENPDQTSNQLSLFSMGARTYSAWYIAAIMVLIHLLIASGAEHQAFVQRFGADAAQITAGHIYRCVTALLLHADFQHLLGNIAGLVLFGSVAASLCGWGLGWLMILAAGASGNLVTALWYGHDHLAIGASTAIFGAVGICTAVSLWMRLWEKTRDSNRSWRRWMPLAGGLALLGLLGTSPRADLAAHLAGFVDGLILGALGQAGGQGRLLYQAPAWMHWTAAMMAAAIVAAAWIQGMHYKG